MDESSDKKYENFKIPQPKAWGLNSPLIRTSPPPPKVDINVTFDEMVFSEVEISVEERQINTFPLPQKIERVKDEKRELFHAMREIAIYNHASYFANSSFYNKQEQFENAKIFYKQAVFMKDYEDEFEEETPFSHYFPYYQLMNYNQLRTYFSWRTKVRQGYVDKTSLSYVYVYIYELLNNIGSESPQSYLSKLMYLWEEYSIYDNSMDKYILRWIKDYHVYYELPWSFKDFLLEHNLQEHFPEIISYNADVRFDYKRIKGFSKYDIKASKFCDENNDELINDCLNDVIARFDETLGEKKLCFKDFLFQAPTGRAIWSPFQGALFYSLSKRTDKQVVLSENEVYVCFQNKWYVSAFTMKESGKGLISYIFKQSEVVLRKLTKYKYKLSANIKMVNEDILQALKNAGISLESFVSNSVIEFYRERNKTVVSVDSDALKRIRVEALDTQEKLIVPEENIVQVCCSQNFAIQTETEKSQAQTIAASEKDSFHKDSWTSLTNVLTPIELGALKVLFSGGNLKKYSDEKGVMLEVLADGINEKALDIIGDNLMDSEDGIYDEYREYLEKIFLID